MYTDKDILEQLKQNQENGAKLVMEKYTVLVRSVCADKLNNKEDIEECVNDVFTEFCMNYGRYDAEKGSLKKYLCVIAERKAVDKFRKNCRKQRLEDEVIKRYQEEQSDRFHQIKDEERLNEAIEQLPSLEQQILKMHYYDGLKYTEIAQELDMNYENVRKRGLRGKKKLLYLILLGIMLLGITACTAKIMKYYGCLPSWFPFYEWFMSDELEDGKGIEQNMTRIQGNEKVIYEMDEEENEDDALEEIPASTEQKTSARKYYVTTKKGYVWSDKSAYEMIQNTQVYQKDDITYSIEYVFYQDGKWEIEICVSCSDMERVMANYVEGVHTPEEWVEIWSNMSESWEMQERKYLSDSYLLMNGEKLKLNLIGGYAMPYEKAPDAYVFQFTGEGVPKNEGEEQIQVSFVLPDGRAFDVTLAKLEIRETESEDVEETAGEIEEETKQETEQETEEGTEEEIKEETEKESEVDSLKLPGNVEVRKGISTLSDGTAIVGLSQENIGEYKITDMLTRNSFWHNGVSRSPVLIDSEGNTYRNARVSRKDVETEEGTRSEFEIYFQGIEPGDYTLEIPQIALKKDMETEVIELPLPTGEEDSLACDLEILFSDGTGFHVTEIKRSEGTKYKYWCDDGVNWRLIEVHVWKYELVYEPVSVSEIKFVTAQGKGVDVNGNGVYSQLNEDKDGNEIYVFEVESEDMPGSLNLQFFNPVYLLEQKIEFNITIQEE